MISPDSPSRPERHDRARAVPGRLRRLLRPKRLMILAGVLLILGGGAIALRVRAADDVATPQTYTRPLPIALDLAVSTPPEAMAGEPFDVRVEGIDAADDSEVLIVLDTGYRTRRFEIPAKDGSASVTVPPNDLPTSGVATVTAIAGRQTGTATLSLIAAEAVDPLDLFLGPRTIEATGQTATMIVGIPRDAFGNPVPDDSPVDIRVRRPDGSIEETELRTDGLIAWTRIESGTIAGRSRVAASAGDAGGQELDFLEIAGTPEPFEVFAIDPPIPADGRSLIRVSTSELRDRFDNVLPDGIDVYANVFGRGGTRRLRSQTIKGLAEFTIEAPSLPGTESIVVVVSGTRSDPLVLDFAAMVEEIDVVAVPDEDGFAVTVGPVFSTLGGFIPDGTPVTVTSEHGVDEYPSFGGIAEFIVPPTDEPIVVEILGAGRRLRIEDR